MKQPRISHAPAWSTSPAIVKSSHIRRGLYRHPRCTNPIPGGDVIARTPARPVDAGRPCYRCRRSRSGRRGDVARRVRWEAGHASLPASSATALAAAVTFAQAPAPAADRRTTGSAGRPGAGACRTGDRHRRARRPRRTRWRRARRRSGRGGAAHVVLRHQRRQGGRRQSGRTGWCGCPLRGAGQGVRHGRRRPAARGAPISAPAAANGQPAVNARDRIGIGSLAQRDADCSSPTPSPISMATSNGTATRSPRPTR